MTDDSVLSSLVDVRFNDDRSYKAEIHLRRDRLFQVVVYREIQGDREYEPETYWSPVGREAILADTLDRARTLAEDELRAR